MQINSLKKFLKQPILSQSWLTAFLIFHCFFFSQYMSTRNNSTIWPKKIESHLKILKTKVTSIMAPFEDASNYAAEKNYLQILFLWFKCNNCSFSSSISRQLNNFFYISSKKREAWSTKKVKIRATEAKVKNFLCSRHFFEIIKLHHSYLHLKFSFSLQMCGYLSF